MKHTIHFDEDNQILILNVIDDFSTAETRQLGSLYNQFLEGKPYRQLIVNLSKAGKMESRETRAVTNEMVNAARLTDVAFVGASSVARMITKVLMKLGSLKAQSNYVKDTDEAINWLKNRRK